MALLDFTRQFFIIFFSFSWGLQSNTPTGMTFLRYDHFDDLLFKDRKLFTKDVDSHNDCLLLCISQSDCLSIVHIVEYDGEVCTGYSIVFQDDTTAIYYSHATYYAIAKGECNEPYVFDTTSKTCFKLITDQLLNRSDADNYCKMDAGSLVTIETSEKQTALIGYLDSLGAKVLSGTGFGYFVGGYKTSGGLWMWSDNKAFDFTDWKGGKPQNSKHCLKMKEDNPYFWAAATCGTPRHFICERHVF